MTWTSLQHMTQGVAPFPRLLIAVLAAVALISGVLNIRPAMESVSGASAIAPSEPSAIETLTGTPERPQTALDARIESLQETLRGGDERATRPAGPMLGQAYLQKARETGDPSYYPKAETLFRQAP